MVTTLSLHQQGTMVSALNVLLLTLNKALPGGHPRITRFVLMPISLWIKFNHASCSLYLSLYLCSGLNVWCNAYIHRPFKSSMVFGLKCLLRSNLHGVKFDWWTSELILIDIGCICGLTLAETSIPNGKVIELSSNGKVRWGSGLILHGILILT